MSEVKRYDCTSGGSQFCYGCYTMTEEAYGDYVRFEDYETLRAELAGKEKALAAAKTVIEAKDKAYALIDQRFAAMAAKAATTDSERECNERLTAEIDALTAELAEARRQLKEAPDGHLDCWANNLNSAGEAIAATLAWVNEYRAKRDAAPVPQPAVPDDVARDAAVGAAIQRAARDLPEWCAIEVRVERGSATVYAYDKECDEVPIETSGDESLADEIDAALAAILSATATKEGRSNG